MSNLLEKAPAYLRAQRSSGTKPTIDRDGGFRGAGVIRGVSVITEGEALGHEMWIDSEFNEQVAEAINQRNQGIKSRFTHPGLSGDGLGRHLGRLMDARVIGDKVVADQHFTESAHSTPDGDLASYLMDLAEEDPEAYGLSIVFKHDVDAEEEFTRRNLDPNTFISPDSRNTENYPHARLAELRAADAVDEPAANPDGLFHREQNVAEEATALASFALGLSHEKPHAACLGIEAGRVRRFVAEFLSSNDLEIIMNCELNDTPVDQVENEAPVENAEAEDQTTEETTTEETSEAPAETTPALAEKTGRDFLEAFGDQGGVWYAEGKSFEMCLALQNKALQEKIEELEKRSSIPGETGEDTPVDFNGEQDSKKRKGFASKIRIK